MKEFGTRAIQLIIPAIAFYRNDFSYNLAWLYNPITCFQCIPTENKVRRVAVSPLYMNDSMCNDALLHTIEDDVPFSNSRARFNLYNLPFDGIYCKCPGNEHKHRALTIGLPVPQKSAEVVMRTED
jgi:hypothetical protein